MLITGSYNLGGGGQSGALVALPDHGVWSIWREGGTVEAAKDVPPALWSLCTKCGIPPL